jgi:hypothetical protein
VRETEHKADALFAATALACAQGDWA